MGSSKYHNVEQAASSTRWTITIVVAQPFPLADLAGVLKVDESVVKGADKLSLSSEESSGPCCREIGSHKQRTNQ